MPEALNLLAALRAQVAGLRAIADAIEATILELEGIEAGDDLAEVARSELKATIKEIDEAR